MDEFELMRALRDTEQELRTLQNAIIQLINDAEFTGNFMVIDLHKASSTLLNLILKEVKK
jgi:hypothetical protein